MMKTLTLTTYYRMGLSCCSVLCFALCITLISQSTFVTLFAGEMGYDLIDELVEDMVVKSALQDFDKSLEELLSEETDEEGGA